MLYDLNVPWNHGKDQDTASKQLLKTIAVLQTLGYTGIAVNLFLNTTKDLSTASLSSSGLKIEKFSSSHKCPISKESLQKLFPKLKLLTRVTVIVDDSFQQSISFLAKEYDIIAIRPLTERSLQNISTNTFDLVDIISLDCTKRVPFFLKHHTAGAAIQKGIKFEIIYAGATSGKTTATGITNSDSRKNVITSAATIIRASRGRGLIASSEALSPFVCRSPYDVINLLCVWGLDHMRAHQAVAKFPELVVKNAYLRKNSHKQVIMVSEKKGSESAVVAEKRPLEEEQSVNKKHKIS